MDVKAAARSKRAQSQRAKSKHTSKHPHSQQHKKNEPQQAQTSNPQEAPKPQIGNPSKTLPTNWGRYEDLHSSGSEGERDVAKEEEGAPIKSKGADYEYLLSQAQEQAGFDAYIMPEYAESISSMLYVRGRNLLSWGEDDNFILKDDSTTAEYEASFLSLDLHALATQLTQLERSKRLFIEEDKLPAELRASDSQAGKHQVVRQEQVHSNYQNELTVPSQAAKSLLWEGQDQVHSNESESTISKVQSVRESNLPPDPFPVTEETTENANLKDCADMSILSMKQEFTFPERLGQGMVHSYGKSADQHLSTSLGSQMRVGAPPSKAVSTTYAWETSSIETIKPHRSSLKISEESNEVAMRNVKAETGRFEVAAAEAELDALLDALDEPSNIGASKVNEALSDPVFTEKSQYKGKQSFQDKLHGPSNLLSRNNNDLDDLLGKKVKGGPNADKEKNTSGLESIAASTLAPKSRVSLQKNAPKVLEEDFDAWLDTI